MGSRVKKKKTGGGVPVVAKQSEPEKTDPPPAESKGVVSSRLCVKNLPIDITEQKLRAVFAAFNDSVTDAKIMKTRSGQSRKFGFIGFRNPEAAAAARKHFDQSFIGSFKIAVEMALPTGSANLPRPWSKYSMGSSAHPDTIKAKEAKDQEMEQVRLEREQEKIKRRHEKLAPELAGLSAEEIEKVKKDPKFAAFLNVMKPRKKTKFWEDDDMRPALTDEAITQSTLPTLPAKPPKSKGEGSDESSDEDDEAFANPSIDEVKAAPPAPKPEDKMTDLQYLKSKQAADFDDDSDVANEGEEGDEGEEEEEEEEEEKGPAAIKHEQPTEKSQGGGNRQGSQGSQVEKSQGGERSQGGEKGGAMSVRDEADAIAETGRLFLRNLAYTTTLEDLSALFSPYGTLSEVTLPLDSTKRPKGIAYVAFTSPGCAVKAFQELDKTSFLGRLLHILPSRLKPNQDNALSFDSLDDDTKDGLTYKKKKDLKLKAASQNDDTWNTLFIRSDTVADSIAAKYSVKKSELLDLSAGNLAVKLSLAESQLIKETRDFLKEQGVSLEAFEGKKSTCERSRCIILVKNIPFETDVDELKRLFGKFGHLRRVCLPPAKTMAIVEYVERTDAEKGFTNLAFKKFKHVPLYLEWAPKNVFTSTTPVASAAVGAGIAENVDASLEDIGETGTLFVKNLNFETTPATLKKVFETVGPVRTATVARKKDPKNPDGWLSMGYGFVEYAKKAHCVDAVKALQGREIDGHAIQLKISNRTSTSAKASSGKALTVGDTDNAPCTKITVKNLAFEVTKKELRELFATFGQVKSCRIPKKFDGSHRGFGFVDFLTKQEAKNAFEALQSSHLYGRHLVLKWATEEDTLDVLRKKTQEQFPEPKAKKAKTG